MDFPSPLNAVKTDDTEVCECWGVPVGVLMVVMCTRVYIVCY